MSYEKINWENSPSTKTPINAENLNKMDQGIYDAHQELGKLPEWSKKETKPEYTAEEVGALPNDTDIPSKTSDLENDSGFITKEVRDLANYYTKREVDHLKANAILSKSTGETISITDAAPVPPLNIIPYGKSTQKRYEGNQLYDADNMANNNCTVENGVITITKDTTDTYIKGTYPTGTTEVLFELLSGSYSLGCSNSNVLVTMYYEINDTIQQLNTNVVTSTITEDVGIEGVRIRSVDGTSLKGVSFKIMLNAGDTLKEWEPYVGGEASPNLNYQQEVVPLGASGSIVHKLLTSNFLNIPNVTRTENGITVVAENGVVHVSGTVTAVNNVNIALVGSYGSTKTIATLYKGTYTLKDATFTTYDGTNRKFYYPNTTFTVEDKMEINWICTPPYASGQVVSKTLYPRIVLDETLPFEPYSEQSLTYQTPNGLHGIPLGTTIPDAIKNSPIHMRGVYWDNVEQQYYIGNTKNENGKDVQRVWSGKPKKTIVFTSQNASYVCSAFDTGIFGVKFLNGDIPSMSTIAPWSKWALTDKTIAVSTNGLFYTDKSKTLEEVNALFTELGTDFEVEGILDTPIVTDTSEEELAQFNALRMNYPNTTIVNDAGAYTEVEYVCDTKEHIKQNYAPKSEIQEMKDQIAELQALMVNNS